MEQLPTLKEQQALGFLFQKITASNPSVWRGYLWEKFCDLNPIVNSGISQLEAQNTLQRLPRFAKRRIMHWVVMGWNFHHNFEAFKQAVIIIVSMKVCGPTEYFCLQYVYNFMNEFKVVCKSLANIEIRQNIFTPYTYTIQFGWNNPNYYVVFELNKPIDTPAVAIMLTNKLLQDTYGNGCQSDLEAFVSNNICPLFLDEFVKDEVTNVESDMKFGACLTRNNDGIILGLNELKFMYR